MPKKQFYAILDTETTIADTVADIAIVICDRQGVIQNQMAVLIREEFTRHDLFYDKNATGLWSYEYAQRKKAMYLDYLNAGTRTLASRGAVNNWISKAIGQYNPILTAYNLAFDKAKCKNTMIDLSGFADSFCLWQAACGNICQLKTYRNFVAENHLFNSPTEKRNMTYSTNAESVASFLQGEMMLENHDALGDVLDFELPILKNVLKRRKWKEKITPYNWKSYQVKNNFTAKIC